MKRGKFQLPLPTGVCKGKGINGASHVVISWEIMMCENLFFLSWRQREAESSYLVEKSRWGTPHISPADCGIVHVERPVIMDIGIQTRTIERNRTIEKGGLDILR